MISPVNVSESRRPPDDPPGQTPRFLKIAHRGYSERYPENTLPAFEKAILAGADMIELDVHLSRDNHLVVIHDDTIERTSSGRGRVRDLTLAALKGYNYNYGMTSLGFVEIPTLEEVFALVGNRVMLNIEVKKIRGKQREIEARLVRLLEREGCLDRIIVSSFDEEILREISRTAGEVRTGMLYDRVLKNFRDKVLSLGVYSVHPAIRAIDEGQLRWAKTCGRMVYPWVARDRGTLEKCRASGFIDGCMVNDLALFPEP